MERLAKELSIWEKETADIMTMGKRLEEESRDDVRKKLANMLNREMHQQSIEVMESGRILYRSLNELIKIIEKSEQGKQFVKKYKR